MKTSQTKPPISATRNMEENMNAPIKTIGIHKFFIEWDSKKTVCPHYEAMNVCSIIKYALTKVVKSV